MTLTFLFVIALILVIVFGGKSKPKKAYDASFGDSSDVLSSFNKGFCVSGNQSMTRKASYQGFLVCGPTGSYKTTTTIIPSLFKMDGPSFICFDPSGQIFSTTSGAMAKKGYEISVLSFSDPSISQSFNPISYANSSSEIYQLATLLNRHSLGGKNQSDPFWSIQASNLIAMCIMILKEGDSKFHNLTNVRYLLNLLAGNPELVDELFSKTTNEELYSEYRAICAYDSKLLTNIISSAQASLQLVKDENISKLTATDTIDLKSLRKKKRVIYIQSNLMSQSYLRPLFASFIEAAFSQVLSKLPDDSDNDLFFLFDEAGSLWLPNLAMMVSNCRKYRAGVLAIAQQGLSQFTELYGTQEAKTIRANLMTQLYLSGQDLETSKELEQILGKTTLEPDENGKEVVRSLMLHNEIRQLPDREAILLVSNKPAYRISITPFFKNIWIRGKSKIPPPTLSGQVSMERVPLIPLEKPTYEKA